MPLLSELNAKERKTYLLYGHSGSGKTVLACSFPGPIKVFDFDNKISSAANFYANNAERLGQIDYTAYTVEKLSKDPLANRPFRRFIDDFNRLGSIPVDKFPFKTVVLDSLTSFAEQLMTEEMLQNASPNRQSMGGVSVPHMADYLVSITYCKSVLSQLLSLPCNVVIIGHLSQDKDELTGEITRQVAIWGKDLPGWIPKVCEEAYYMYAKQEGNKLSYWAQTQQGNRYVARSQLKGIPPQLDVTEGFNALKKYF